MQFSNTTSKDGLIQDCEARLDMNDGDISGNSTLLKRFTSLINQHLHRVSTLIIRATSPQGWKWDDLNYSDFAIGSQNLVEGQHDYALPTADGTYTAIKATTLLNLNSISVLDQDGNQKKLLPTSRSEAELNAIYTQNGQPEVYKLVGGSAKVWPAPDAGTTVTLTNGFIADFTRSVSEFVSTDTTKTPGIPVPFHNLLSIGASEDYADIKTMRQATRLREKRIEREAELLEFISNRNKDQKPKLTRKVTNYN